MRTLWKDRSWIGPNRYYRSRLSFAQRRLDDHPATRTDLLIFEAYPWQALHLRHRSDAATPEDLDTGGVPLRDIREPARRGQPAHIAEMMTLRPGEVADRSKDFGWLHRNSGIHNKAAYHLLTAKENGTAVLTSRDVAGLFYLALTQYLSCTSGFSDSRTGVRLAGQTYFRENDADVLARKLAVIDHAFDAVGIQ